MPQVQFDSDPKLLRETLLCKQVCADLQVTKVLLCSLDEVGRGCIAGPVHTCVGFWLFDRNEHHLNDGFSELAPRITDSKKLSPKARMSISVSYKTHWNLYEPNKGPSSLPQNGIKPWPKSLLRIWCDDLVPKSANSALKKNSQNSPKSQLLLLSSALGESSSLEIDQFNIWQAVQWAFNRALATGIHNDQRVQSLWADPNCAIVFLMDGKLPIGLHDKILTPLKTKTLQFVAKGGDALFATVGLSSILAKTFRDDQIAALGLDFPGYGFENHKGYGTAFHFERIRQLPLTPHHRLSFLKNL